MTEMNINCKHKQVVKKEKEKIDFCKKCGCFIIIKYSDKHKEVESYSILPKKMITPLDISPYDTVENIIKQAKDAELSSNFNNIPEEYYNIRKTLIELLKEYIIDFNFTTRSYFLGIYFLDYIYSKYSYQDVTAKFKTDLLVLGVFLNAIKFIDDDAYPPGLDTFPSKKNPSIYYNLNEVRRYEFMVAKLMEYKMDIFTSYYLTETMLSHGVVFTYEIESMGITSSKVIKDTIKKLYRLALDINKMFIEDINSLRFNSLEISATCIMMAKELLKFENNFNKELQYAYKIDTDNLVLCYNSILKAYEQSSYHTGNSTSTTNMKKVSIKNEETIPDTQVKSMRAVNRSASSSVVSQGVKSVLSSVDQNKLIGENKGREEKSKKLAFNIEPINEDEEHKKLIPPKMSSNLLKDKTVSLESKDILKENLKQQVNPMSRFSTKEVAKVKEVLNKKK